MTASATLVAPAVAGECNTTLSVPFGTTVFYTVGLGGAAVTGLSGHPGTNSWINISANAQAGIWSERLFLPAGGLVLGQWAGAGGAGGAGSLGLNQPHWRRWCSRDWRRRRRRRWLWRQRRGMGKRCGWWRWRTPDGGAGTNGSTTANTNPAHSQRRLWRHPTILLSRRVALVVPAKSNTPTEE